MVVNTFKVCLLVGFVYLKTNIKKIIAIKLTQFIFFFRSYPSNLHIVDCFEHYCSQNTMLKTIDVCLKDELYNLLKVNLNSPYQKLRLLTLMLLENMYAGNEEDDVSSYKCSSYKVLQLA